MRKMVICLLMNGDIQIVPVKDEDPLLSIRQQIGKGCEDVQTESIVDKADFSFPVFLVTGTSKTLNSNRLNLNASVLSASHIFGNAVLATSDGENICGMSEAQIKVVREYLLSSAGAVA